MTGRLCVSVPPKKAIFQVKPYKSKCARMSLSTKLNAVVAPDRRAGARPGVVSVFMGEREARLWSLLSVNVGKCSVNAAHLPSSEARLLFQCVRYIFSLHLVVNYKRDSLSAVIQLKGCFLGAVMKSEICLPLYSRNKGTESWTGASLRCAFFVYFVCCTQESLISDGLIIWSHVSVLSPAVSCLCCWSLPWFGKSNRPAGPRDAER